MAVIHKAIFFVVQKLDHSLYDIHWAYESCYLFFGQHQAYTTLQNLQEYDGLPNCFIAKVMKSLKLFL